MHLLIIGVGSIGERHLRNFLRIEGVRCSIAEPNAALCDKIAAEYKVEQSYPDYHDTDLSTFDGVVICAPTNLHVPIATDVVAAGTHVLTEKPLAMSLDGIDKLKHLRDQNNVAALVGFTFRSNPLIAEIKQLLDAGRIGTVHMVTYYAGQYWPRFRKDYPPKYAQKRQTGGGIIPDHLIHQINFFEWMFGNVEKVSGGQWNLALKEIATEDAGFATICFADGPIAQLGTAIFQRDSNLQIQIIGDTGTIRMLGGSDSIEIFDDKTGQWTKGKARTFERDDMFHNQAKHFIDCIHGKAKPVCTIEQAEQTLRTVLAALESADSDSRFVKVRYK